MSNPQRETPADDPFAGLPLLIPVPRAAKLLGISRAAAYRFASAGDLPTKRLGRRVYVVSAKLREFIETEEEAACRGTSTSGSPRLLWRHLLAGCD
jgi:predicted DNA-binding transcriptional regulator AlpA